MKALAIKTFFILFSIIALSAAGVLGYAYYWYSSNTKPVSDVEQSTELVIKSGTTFADIAQELENKGIIKNAFAFRVWTKLSGEDVTVQAGAHTVSSHMTFKQLVKALSVGIQDVKILLKEGLRSEEIADILEQNLDKTAFDKDAFLKLAKQKEGMLFPDTYIFQKNISADAVFAVLNKQFETKYAQIAGPVDATEKKKIVIIASMLEREGKSDNDRPVIAGILLNRLNKQTEASGFLQIDATVQYALNETKRNTSTWWPTPRAQDLQVDSVYNTYKNPGLPPSAICNPGLSSLKAVINPQENNYVYYIHDNSGKAYYARTLVEHNQNIARYLR